MKLRLLTLNTWGISWPVGRDVAERIAAIGAELSTLDLDVAALQEVWTEEARSLLVGAGLRAGLRHVWHNPEGPRGSGLLVLSRLPIAAVRFHPFDLGGLPENVHHADYWGGKGFAELDLRLPDGALTLIDTHLHAAYGPRELDPYMGHRVGQVVQLAARVRKLAGPVIACGDFNFESGFPEYRILTGIAGLQDTAANLGREDDTVLAGNPYRTRNPARSARIDYVFTRDGRRRSLAALAIERVLAEPLEIAGRLRSYSDHAGLRAELELGAPGAAPAPADAGALDLAHALLLEGRAATQRGRRDFRLGGAAGIVAAPLLFTAGRDSRFSRRGFLKGAFAGAAGVSGLLGVGSVTLAEAFRANDLRAFDAALQSVAALRRT